VSWALYIRSQTGAFPPFVARLESQLESKIRAVTSGIEKRSEQSAQVPGRAADAHNADHNAEPPRPQNPATAEAPAVASQTSAIPAASSPAAVPTLQPVTTQASGDHPISESAPVSGTPLSSQSVETSQKPVDPSQATSPQAVESQRAAGNENAHDSPSVSSASRDDDKQTAQPFSPKPPPGRKRAAELPLTVEGFSRQDIPDLLSQANSSTVRGDYRLARYEYGLVLKLDRNNVQAREGLRRLAVAWQSR
jgi:hypothetical protein